MNQTAIALKFGRLLNEARLRLQAHVDGCGRCTAGVIACANPDGSGHAIGEACEDCGDDRDFLARCAQMVGPTVPATPKVPA